MTPASVAAARPGSERKESFLRSRLQRLIDTSGPEGEGRLAGRLLPASSLTDATPPYEGFYWLQAAEWLADAFDRRSTACGHRFFEDLCWVQYCVYATFRVQDDLVDGDTRDPLLAVEANRLLVEASRCAARHFEGSSPFWSVFQGSIEATSRAIASLDELQRTAEREPHKELKLYVDLAACLRIAAAAMAIGADREELWEQRIAPALDRLAVAGQILDDLQDLEEDLRAGRLNYAAWSLGRPIFGATPEATLTVIASNLATGERLAELLDVPKRLVAEAAEVLGRTVCPPLHAYLLRYRDGVDAVESEMSARRDMLLLRKRAA